MESLITRIQAKKMTSEDEVPMIVSIIIPTFNEYDSIRELLPVLFETLEPIKNKWICHIVVVDGNSPDGTAKSVQEIQKHYKNLHLIVEKQKNGIGAAYYQGFRYAVDELHSDVLIEFDADFQHPPQTIPVLLDRIEAGADLVLGSRRIQGGSYPPKWGFRRRFLSQFGGFVARLILFFPSRRFLQITDPTTGLKATRVKNAYEVLNTISLKETSFSYKLEMLYHIARAKVLITEIPLSFGLRGAGESKITNRTATEILNTVLRLRFHDPAVLRFIRFGIVGLSGFFVNALCLEYFRNQPCIIYLTTLFKLPLLMQVSAWSAAISAEISIINNFIWNNFWTFGDRKKKNLRDTTKAFLAFNATSVGAILIQFISMGISTLLFGDTTVVRILTLIFAITFMVLPYNWLMYNFAIWRKNE